MAGLPVNFEQYPVVLSFNGKVKQATLNLRSAPPRDVQRCTLHSEPLALVWPLDSVKTPKQVGWTPQNRRTLMWRGSVVFKSWVELNPARGLNRRTLIN